MRRQSPWSGDWGPRALRDAPADLGSAVEHARAVATGTITAIRSLLEDRDASLDDVIEALNHPNGRGGRWTSLASSTNVWPGEDPSKCAPVLVAVARGPGATRGLTGAMAAIRRHLVACTGITQEVILVTDTWSHFDSAHRGDWEAHAARGVRFTVLIAGAGVGGAVELPLALRSN